MNFLSINEVKSLAQKSKKERLKIYVNGVVEKYVMDDKQFDLQVEYDKSSDSLRLIVVSTVNRKDVKAKIAEIAREEVELKGETFEEQAREKQEFEKQQKELLAKIADGLSKQNKSNQIVTRIGVEFLDFLDEVKSRLPIVNKAIEDGKISDQVLIDAQPLKDVQGMTHLTELNAINITTSDYYLVEVMHKRDNGNSAGIVEFNDREGRVHILRDYDGKQTKKGLFETYVVENFYTNLDLSKQFLGQGGTLHEGFSRIKLLTDYVPLYVKLSNFRNTFWEMYDQDGFTLTSDEVHVAINSEDFREGNLVTNGYVRYTTLGRIADVFGIYPKRYSMPFWQEIIAGLVLGNPFPNRDRVYKVVRGRDGRMEVITEEQYQNLLNSGNENVQAITMSSIEFHVNEFMARDNVSEQIILNYSSKIQFTETGDLWLPERVNEYGYKEKVTEA